MSNENNIIIFDTTLRDGEQSPGCSMNLEEKIKIFEILESLRVDVIEAGFAIASQGDFEAVKNISKLSKHSTICSLARAKKEDIERAHDALKYSDRRRIHTFIATSDLHIKYKLQSTREKVLEAIEDSVRCARNLTDDVEWSAEDGSRTDLSFLCKCIERAISAGASTVNIPDTVGYSVPLEYQKMIKSIKNKVVNIDKAIISVHCHNDLGLAVANSISALESGARQIECTINGIGERAGNASMEEIVMAIKTRKDVLPYHTNIKTKEIIKASRLLSAVTGFSVQPNKAIVGANAFAHESGIHQDGMLKHAGTFEIMKPEDIGLTETNLVMGKHSGRAALRKKVSDLGFNLGDNQLQDLFVRFKALADRKKEVYDEDLLALLADNAMTRNDELLQLVDLEVTCGTKAPQIAKATIAVEGKNHSVESIGDGPVDAVFNAVKKVFPHSAHLQHFQIHAVTEGTDAQATVSVRLEEAGKMVTGQSSDTDTVVASAKAYINSLNKLVLRRKKTAPEVTTN